MSFARYWWMLGCQYVFWGWNVRQRTWLLQLLEWVHQTRFHIFVNLIFEYLQNVTIHVKAALPSVRTTARHARLDSLCRMANAKVNSLQVGSFGLYISRLSTDVDECVEQPELCSGANEKCVNERGSYSCKCKKGYKKRGEKCIKGLNFSSYNFILLHILTLINCWKVILLLCYFYL
jgi:hypothetical protein